MKIRILIIFVFLFNSTNNLFGQTGLFTLRGKIFDTSSSTIFVTDWKIIIYDNEEIVAITKTELSGTF